MTELAEIIAHGISEADLLVIPETPILQPEKKETNLILNETTMEYPLIDFSTWFNKHYQKFSNLRLVRVSISGVDASDNIIITIPTTEKQENGDPKRKIKIFENAKQSKILDLDPQDLTVFNNGYRVTYQVGDNMIKGYGVKTGMFLTICHIIKHLIVPINIIKITRKDVKVKVTVGNIQDTIDKLSLPGDVESLQILYNQSMKHAKNLKTKQDIVEWFAKRQEEVGDVNHHLQIDEVLLKLI
jgi:hypothetical protein